MKGGSSLDYFKQRRAYRQLKMNEIDVSNGQNNLYRELLDYANDESKLDVQFRMKNSALLSLTGLSEPGLDKARNFLAQAGLIKYIKGKKNVKAPEYQIIQLYKSQSMSTSYPTSNPTSLNKSMSTSLDKVGQPVGLLGGQPVGHKRLTNTDSNQTNKNKRPRSKSPRTYAPTEQPYQIAEHLYKRILEHQDLKKPNLQKWADEVRLAHERDGRDYDKLNKLVDWAQDNDFWQGNILSTKKLREKYDTLTGQANREYKQNELNQHDSTPRDFGGSTRYRHEAKPEPIRTPQKGDEPF